MADLVSSKASVNSPSRAYQEMAGHWILPHALMGGTQAMRTMAKVFLPKEPRENEKAYWVRLQRTVLFPGYRKTITSLAAKPFRRPVTLEDGAPPQIEDLIVNIDNTGRNLTSFAHDIFTDAMNDGIAYILVDYPIVQAGATVADERTAGVRPYFCALRAEDVIEARFETDGAAERLTRVRIRIETTEPDGDFGEKIVRRVKVITPNTYQVWIESPDNVIDNGWSIESEGVNTLGEIALVPVFTGRVAPFVATPPLEDLAYLNLRHWQSQSDQDNILHVARVPILFVKGLPKSTQIEVGPNSMVRAESATADMKYVEHTGAAIDAGQKDLDSLREQMAVLGYEPLISRPGAGITATQRAIDAAEAQADLQAWARALENALEKAFAFAAQWLRLADIDIDVLIDTDFSLSIREEMDIRAITQARAQGDLSRETFWNEMRRRNILPESFDPLEEQSLIEKEGPLLATMAPAGKNEGQAVKAGSSAGGFSANQGGGVSGMVG
jgi:hypothetical protein